ncbi:hypothetical protein [Gloeomargarita lithophora]|uniref:hypothetical protein n=1 Tax=Gloeomargarita lithophora TaxID=1188228 RepID=UPI0012FD32E6|nr:hypothetical protein [Gloeomargarita lithophora]
MEAVRILILPIMVDSKNSLVGLIEVPPVVKIPSLPLVLASPTIKGTISFPPWVMVIDPEMSPEVAMLVSGEHRLQVLKTPVNLTSLPELILTVPPV